MSGDVWFERRSRITPKENVKIPFCRHGNYEYFHARTLQTIVNSKSDELKWWNCFAWMQKLKCLSLYVCNFRSLAQYNKFTATQRQVFPIHFHSLLWRQLCVFCMLSFVSDRFLSERNCVHCFRPKKKHEKCIPSKWHSNRTTHRERKNAHATHRRF